MLRNARSVAQVLRSLLLGTAAVATVATSAVMVVGCADENQPETWVKRLDDPVTRPAAIKRLMQFFEDAMTRSNKNREDANVKALLDKIVEPLTKTYVGGNLDDRTRIELIKFLADTRDARAKTAWFKACTDFGAGKGATEDDVRWSAPAIGALKLADGAQPLADAFVKLQAGTQKGSQAYKNLSDAMLQVKSPSWKAMLLERINRPMERVVPGATPDKVTAFQNEQFWQITAAQLLGELKETDAVKPLFKVVLNPQKADVAATASAAIMKIGKPAVPVLIDAMLGKDKEVVDAAAAASGGNAEEAKAYVRTAAVVLGALGSGDATLPMLQALGAADSDVNRAVLARELTKLPTTADAQKAFQAAFDKLGPSVMIPPAQNAKASLMEEASHFYDSELVPWVVKEVNGAKGADDEKGLVQTAGLLTSIKLMNKGQIGDVQKAVDKFGTQIEKDAFKLASEVLNACGDQFACYLSKVQEPAAQAQKTQFTGIKAGYMLGILGNAGSAQQIIAAMPKVKNASVRFVIASALDHLVQKDATPVADALQKMVDEDKAKGDAETIRADEAVKQVVYRLRAR